MAEPIEIDFLAGGLGQDTLNHVLSRARTTSAPLVDIVMRRIDPMNIATFVDTRMLQEQIEEGVRNTFLRLDIPGQVKAAVLEAMEQARLNS